MMHGNSNIKFFVLFSGHSTLESVISYPRHTHTHTHTQTHAHTGPFRKILYKLCAPTSGFLASNPIFTVVVFIEQTCTGQTIGISCILTFFLQSIFFFFF